MNAAGKTRHVHPITVRWADMDSMGHINNAKYFTYCESAHMSYFATVRMNEHRENSCHGTAVAAATLNFRRQVRYPSELDVATRVIEIGHSSLKMEYLIFYHGTDERVADGTGVIVWVDYATGRSMPLPEGLREEIRRFERME